MNFIQSGAQAESTVAGAESPKAADPPEMRFPDPYSRHPPSLASTIRQVFVQSLIAVLLVLVSTVLWAATFGGLSMFAESPAHCPQHNLGSAPFAVSSIGEAKL